MLTLYGIPNCDTVKKARAWLEQHGIDYHFHDYKKAGIDAVTLGRWCDEFGFEQVLNQRGTTWRKLDESARSNLNQSLAVKLMQAQPSVIRRPVIDSGSALLLGFNAASYQGLLSK
ncbi:MAG: ArsC family reductase [Gammaproteobacteria bacterium]